MVTIINIHGKHKNYYSSNPINFENIKAIPNYF